MEKQDTYIDKAVMEMKPNKAGTNSGIALQRIVDDTTDDARHVWTCFIIKCWGKLSMRYRYSSSQQKRTAEQNFRNAV